MNRHRTVQSRRATAAAAGIIALAASNSRNCAYAQAPAAAPAPQPARVAQQQPPPVLSPEVGQDRRVTFRIFAPRAEAVRVTGSDIPGMGPGTAMTKRENGVWEATLGPLDPGAYRYTFNVDGVSVIDPRSPAVSESNNNVWSLLYVPGSDLMDTRNVPHGAVASVSYYSNVMSGFRRMHVYTPPGYEKAQRSYPVLYLLHGASDSDHSWTSVGRAGFIMDNLITSGKAKPMVVVMPAGHTRRTPFGVGVGSGRRPPADEFEQDFLRDILPYVEKNYRVMADRKSRAIAGLSMGGGQTLNLAIPHQEKFAYVGVFSSGLFGAFPVRRPGGPPAPAVSPTGRSAWEEQNLAALDNAEWKKGLKLMWFSTGKDDFLIETTRSTVNLLKKHNFPVVYNESTGGHTWVNWQKYLIEFVPQLFR